MFVVTMKYHHFLLLLSVCHCILAGGSTKHLPDLNEIHFKCQEKSNVTKAILNEAKKGNFQKMNSKLQSHIFCFAQESGYMSETGQLNIEGAKKMMIARVTPKLEQIINDCDSYVQDHSDIEAFATEMTHCFHFYTEKFFDLF